MRTTGAQSLRKIRDESRQPAEMYATVLDVDYYNKSVLVQVGSRATWVQVVSSLALGTRENPIVVPNGQVQLVRWSGDEYVAARYVATMYLPMIGVGARTSAPMASLGTPQWLSGYPRVIGATLEGAWTPAIGATGYEVFANTVPSANGAWRIPKDNPVTYATTQFATPYNTGMSELFSDGFESGDFSRWITYAPSYWKISTTEKHAGNYGARVYGTVEPGDYTPASLHSSAISINPSGTISVTLWYKVTSIVSTGYLEIGYNWLNYDGSSQGEWGLIGITSTGAWTQLSSSSLVAPSNAYGFRLHIRGSAETVGSVTAYIDDAVVTGNIPINSDVYFYAVRAVDGNGNASAFSSWLQPSRQSSSVGTAQLDPTAGIMATDSADAVATKVFAGNGTLVAIQGVDGWTPDSNTWTYASSTSFTIAGDVTAKFPKGTKIMLTQTTVKYFYVVAASYSAPNTTITITGGSDYTLANAAIALPFYSYADCPQGFPVWFNWSPTLGGFSANPTSANYRFKMHGAQCTVTVYQVGNGTSNATTFTITAPITSATVTNMYWITAAQIVNNGSGGASPGLTYISSNSSTITVTADMAGSAFSASNGKRAGFTLTYEV